MKMELTDILACPVCRGNLELNAEKQDDREIVSGFLYCVGCDTRYPIVDTIPNLLPPSR